ncbi:MAG: PEP-CTERM sorting domain-containing protein [Burkholderiaceae bacterium]
MLTFSSTLSYARAPFILAPLVAALAAGQAQAANFAVTNASTSAQTLGSGSGQTGSVSSTGSVTVSGSTVAVTLTGNNATLTNLGTISQTGTGRVIRDNTGVTGLTVNNGSATNATALLQAADADVIQMAKSPASVALNNWGSMISLNASKGGAQAVDFNAIASGANIVNNYAGALLKALEADAVRPGVNGVVNNAGTILSVTTSGGSSDGIDGQNNNGIVVVNSGLVEGGRHGITGGAVDASTAYTMNLSNAVGGKIQGDNGSGVNLDGFNGKQVVTVTNNGTIVGNGITGDGDGVDVDGLVTLINTGVIRSLNAVASGETAFSEGISVGGGTITNSGTIEGLVATGNTNAKGIGVTLTGNDITTGPNAGNRDGLYGNTLLANSAGGVIRGQNSSAIVAKGLPSGFSLSITNAAGGVIQGGGTTDAAIQLGADSATLTTGGTIDGSASGMAIRLGTAGNNKLVISGGAAVVLGSIDGGTGGGNSMKIDTGAGNSFSFASGIANFDKVDVASGTVTLSGVSSYTGTTTIDNGAKLVLDGADRLAISSKLDLEGGTLELVDVAGANAQAFAVLSLGQDSTIALGDSSLTFDALGNLVAGTTLTVTDYLAATSPTYALRFLGDLSHDAAFLALMGGTTIDSLAVSYRFDGVYTDVTAVPEPANVALLLAGLGLVGAAARRRKPYVNA